MTNEDKRADTVRVRAELEADRRSEVLANLTDEEARALGTKLPPGSDHYRAWVGPPYNYDINGAMQFEFFIDLGMREYHKFLEIGCGSLRAGRLIMMYLLPARYFGVEPNKAMLKKGITENFGLKRGIMGNLGGGLNGELIKLKKPKFTHNADFDFSFTGGPVDFVVAQSIASHTGVSETYKLMESIASVCHDKTLAMVTFIRCVDESAQNTKDGWFYPDVVAYTDKFVGDLARRNGLNAYRTKWPLVNQRSDGLITTQTPVIFTRSEWAPPIAHKAYGLRAEGIRLDNVATL